MGEDGIVIGTEIDTSGFKAGTDSIKSACNSLVNSIRASFQKIAGAVGNIAGKGFGVLGKNAKSSMQAVNASANNLLRTFTRMLPAMIGIRGAFGILQRGANSFLSQNRQLQNQLNACWTAIGNVIGPIIEMLVGLLSSLISYLVQFLHLIGLSSKSASQAAKKTGAAAGAMQKSLMGFDEINKLSDGGGGGGSGSLVDPEMPATLQKLGDALKLLMEDLKKTWKEAWDENGRGEKMMQAIKTLLSDIVDLAAEIVLAFDRAWMNADNGKKIFADIMEIITHLANGMDKIVVAMRDWVKTTEWFNIIVQDVRLIFDQLNGISEVLDEKIAPILASKIGKWLDTISQGIHTAMGDIEKIAGNVKSMLESPQGLKMVDSLCEMFISMQKVGWAAVDLVLGSFAKLDMSSYATYATMLSDAIKKAADAVSSLLGNQKLQKTIALLMDIAWAATASALSAIADAISDIANYINRLDWDEINGGLEKLKENLKFGDAESIGTSLGELLTLALDKVPWGEIGSQFAGLINGAISLAKGLIDAFDPIKLAKNADDLLNNAINKVDWTAFGNTLGELIGKALSAVANFLSGLDGPGIAKAIGDLAIGFCTTLSQAIWDVDWAAVGTTIGECLQGLITNGEMFAAVINLGVALGNALVESIVAMIKAILGDKIIAALNELDQKVSDPEGVESASRHSRATGSKMYTDEEAKRVYSVLWTGASAAGEEAATWYSESFKKKLKELGLSDQDAEDYVREFNATVDTLGEDAGNNYANGVIDSINANQAHLEESLSGFRSQLAESSKYSASEISYLENEYKIVFESLGQKGADAYAEAMLNGDFDGVARDFIDSYKSSLDATDTSGILDSGRKTAEDYIAEAKKTLDETPELGSGVTKMLANANIATESDAQVFGESLVAGFIAGILAKLEDLKGAIATLIGEGLGAGDKTFTEWQTSTLQPSLETAGNAVVDYITGVLIPSITQSLSDMQSEIMWGVTYMYDGVTSMTRAMGDAIADTFRDLASAAWSWGADMMNEFASGIYAAYGSVRSAVNSVASMVWSYLHFSEPEEGPLRNFHTFMPDMMKEMAYGINSNIGYPEAAIENVANVLAGNMSLGMPAFAMGSVVPYSVGSGSKSSQEDQMTQFMEMMQTSMFQAFTAALQNQSKEQHGWNVYLDGKQISDSVTKWQRRDDRANGR